MNQNNFSQQRTIVVGLVWNSKNQLLFCKMNPKRGVFPGEWGFPGGGIEPGEKMEQALRRELLEELGIEIGQIKPAFFKDCLHDKTFPDGSKKKLYMIFLLFHCKAKSNKLTLNDEFVEYRWLSETEYNKLKLNNETKDTLEKLGSWNKVYR